MKSRTARTHADMQMVANAKTFQLVTGHPKESMALLASFRGCIDNTVGERIFVLTRQGRRRDAVLAHTHRGRGRKILA